MRPKKNFFGETYVVTGDQTGSHKAYPKLASYRHKVFVERFSRQLQTFNYTEQDLFGRFAD